MDTIRQEIIHIRNNVRKLAESLLDRLHEIHDAVKDQAHAIRDGYSAQQAHRNPEPTVIKVMEGVETRKSPSDKKEESEYQSRTIFWQILTFWAVFGYAALTGYQSWLTRRVIRDSEDSFKKTLCQMQAQTAAQRDSNRITEESLVTVQRAFVFVPRIDISRIANEGKVTYVKFVFTVENSGSTPTKFLLGHISWTWQHDPLPDTFSFPDLWEQGKPHIFSRAVLGPKAIGSTDPASIPAEIIDLVMKHSLHIYFWGWIRYHDVFQRTPEHVTKYCAEITGFDGNPLSMDPAAMSRPIVVNCHGNNCYDEECQQK